MLVEQNIIITLTLGIEGKNKRIGRTLGTVSST